MTIQGQISGYTGIIILSGMLIWLCTAWYIGYTKADKLLGHFKNSPLIINKSLHRHEGPKMVLFLISTITAAVAFPKSHLRDNSLSQDDLDKLPATLRRRLIFMHWTLIMLVTSLFLINYPLMLWEWLANKSS